MHTKTKWIAALASFCAVLVVAIVSMGIIWAASTQTVQTSINITYTVSDVVCDVSANKYFANNTAIPFTGGTNGTVSFAASDTTTTATLTTTDTTLTSANQYVIYEYVFTNNGANTMTAALATGSTTNLDVYVIAPTTTRLASGTTIYTTFDPSTTWTASNSIAATQIESGATAYAYVAMKITNDSANASFAGTFTWTLSNYVAP